MPRGNGATETQTEKSALCASAFSLLLCVIPLPPSAPLAPTPSVIPHNIPASAPGARCRTNAERSRQRDAPPGSYATNHAAGTSVSRAHFTAAPLASTNEAPPATVVPAPFSSSVARVRPIDPNTWTAPVTAYEAPPETSLRSRSPIGTPGTSARRQARVKLLNADTRAFTAYDPPMPVNHAPRVKYPAPA